MFFKDKVRNRVDGSLLLHSNLSTENADLKILFPQVIFCIKEVCLKLYMLFHSFKLRLLLIIITMHVMIPLSIY